MPSTSTSTGDEDRRVPPRVEPGIDPDTIRLGDKVVIGFGRPPGSRDMHYYVAPRSRSGWKQAVWYRADDDGWREAWTEFASREPGHAANYVASLAFSPSWPRRAPEIPILTLPNVPGSAIAEALGLVVVSQVMTRNLFSDLGADFSNALGEQLLGVETAIDGAVVGARQKAYEVGQRLQAHAIVGARADLQTVTDKAQAILLTGTAVRLAPNGGTSSAAPADPSMER